jgi:hypothetical protein
MKQELSLEYDDFSEHDPVNYRPESIVAGSEIPGLHFIKQLIQVTGKQINNYI